MTWPVKVGVWERSTGKLLAEGATATAKQPEVSGWVEAAFASPPTLAAGTVYVVGYLHDRLTGNPGYWTKPGDFATTAEVSLGSCGRRNSSVLGGTGRFHTGATLTMPAEQFGETNYVVECLSDRRRIAGTGRIRNGHLTPASPRPVELRMHAER
jgi:hypothetical protein